MLAVRCLLLASAVQPAVLLLASLAAAAAVDLPPSQPEPSAVRRRTSPLASPPSSPLDKEATSNEIEGNAKFPRGKIPDARLSWKLFLDNNRDDKIPSRASDLSQRGNVPTRHHAADAERETDKQTATKSIVSFAVALRDSVVVAKRSFLELRPFHRPTRENGLLPRSDYFSEDLGRFSVTALGAYQLNAQLHLSLTSNKTEASGRNYARGLVCINSQCQQNAVVEFIQPIAKDVRLFTLSLSGVLYLKPGEYVSVFIDNPSARPLTVLAGSVVTGVLLASS